MSEVQNLKIGDLSALIKSKRGKVGLRATAMEVGVSPSTLSRVEQGKIPDLQTLVKLCEWLEIPVNQFIQDAETEMSSLPINHSTMDTPTIIEAHLRADKVLTPETAQAIATMVRVAYETFTQKGKGTDEKGI